MNLFCEITNRVLRQLQVYMRTYCITETASKLTGQGQTISRGKLAPYFCLILYTDMNLRRIKDLNVKDKNYEANRIFVENIFVT